MSEHRERSEPAKRRGERSRSEPRGAKAPRQIDLEALQRDLDALRTRITADLLDNPGALVAQDDRHRHTFPASIGGVQAAMTHAARGQTHAHLAGAWRREVELLHRQRLPLLEEHRRSMCHRSMT